MVLLNEGAPFIWEFDIDILFVRLLVSDLDISRAFVRCDTQLPMAFKAVHTANGSFFLLSYGRTLVPVVHGSAGLTT